MKRFAFLDINLDLFHFPNSKYGNISFRDNDFNFGRIDSKALSPKNCDNSAGKKREKKEEEEEDGEHEKYKK